MSSCLYMASRVRIGGWRRGTPSWYSGKWQSGSQTAGRTERGLPRMGTETGTGARAGGGAASASMVGGGIEEAGQDENQGRGLSIEKGISAKREDLGIIKKSLTAKKAASLEPKRARWRRDRVCRFEQAHNDLVDIDKKFDTEFEEMEEALAKVMEAQKLADDAMNAASDTQYHHHHRHHPL